MKKIVPLFVIFLLVASIVNAATEASPGVNPDSLFHGLDLILEKARLVFTFSNTKRAELHMVYAAERLAEAKAMANKGKSDLVENSVSRYNTELSETETELIAAKAGGQDLDMLVQKIGGATKKNVALLTSLLDKVPETAKKGIQNAIEKSEKGKEKALEAVGKLEKKEEKAEQKEAKEETKKEKKEEKDVTKEEKTEKEQDIKEEKKESSAKEEKKILFDPTKYSYTVKKFIDHAEIFGKVNGRDVTFRIEGDQYGSDTSLKLRIIREVVQQYGFVKEDAENAMANLKIERGTKVEIPLVKKKKNS